MGGLGFVFMVLGDCQNWDWGIYLSVFLARRTRISWCWLGRNGYQGRQASAGFS